MRLDNSKRLCLTSKALRTADHFLLSRYFDYQQLTFHKTVAGFELVLKDVLEGMLDNELVDFSPETILEEIKKRDWFQYDDSLILNKIRELSVSTEDTSLRAKAKSILQRRPPRLICDSEEISNVEDNGANFLLREKVIKERIPIWAEEFGIDKTYWYVWARAGMKLTRIGSHVPVSSILNSDSEELDKYEQSIRILDSENNSSKEIVSIKQSMMSVLSNYGLYSLRIYILFPEDSEDKRREIIRRIKEEALHINWK